MCPRRKSSCFTIQTPRKSLVLLFFDNDDDYRRGDDALNAMPASDTPGQRTAVSKYQVAFRITD